MNQNLIALIKTVLTLVVVCSIMLALFVVKSLSIEIYYVIASCIAGYVIYRIFRDFGGCNRKYYYGTFEYLEGDKRTMFNVAFEMELLCPSAILQGIRESRNLKHTPTIIFLKEISKKEYKLEVRAGDYNGYQYKYEEKILEELRKEE